MKPCKLQEARIDVAHEAGMRERHLGDDVVAEPVDAAIFRELVDRVGIDAGVDRPAHQHHGMRNVRILVGLHQGDRRHHRHRGLAHRDHMHVAAEHVQHGDDVIDVVVEIEAAVRHRHHARVGPFGDVDVVIGQEGFHRAAQQRRVVARHRRHDQQLRLRAARRAREGAFEMQKPAERTLPHGGDVHRNVFGADRHLDRCPIPAGDSGASSARTIPPPAAIDLP